MSLCTVDFDTLKPGGSTTYRGAGFSDIASEFQHSLFYVILHNIDSSPPHHVLTATVNTIYVRGFGKYACLWIFCVNFFVGGKTKEELIK